MMLFLITVFPAASFALSTAMGKRIFEKNCYAKNKESKANYRAKEITNFLYYDGTNCINTKG